MTTMVLLSLFAAISPIEDVLKQNIPTINVTALKEQVPLDRVASTVSSISYESLQKNGIYRPNSLSSVVPGLMIPEYGASLTSTIYMRGLGSRMENPVMGLYIDGIPIVDKNAYDFDWEGVSRATMLHGPQGTLYGRNAMSGVLSLSTISPYDDYQPTVNVEYGTSVTDFRIRRRRVIEEKIVPGSSLFGLEKEGSAIASAGQRFFGKGLSRGQVNEDCGLVFTEGNGSGNTLLCFVIFESKDGL